MQLVRNKNDIVVFGPWCIRNIM